MSSFSIRPATTDDYEAIAAVINSGNPPVPVVAENLRDSDMQRPDYCKFIRWLAESYSHVVGIGVLEQSPYAYDPIACHAMVRVHPTYQGRGIGQALHQTILARAQQEGMKTVRSGVNESEARALEFATRLGYAEERRVFESALDISTFDPTPFATLLPQLAAQGITIRPYSEVQAEPRLEHDIYDLTITTLADVPTSVPYTMPAFTLFVEQTFHNPQVPLSGILLAFAGEELVGMTYHRAYNDEQMNVNFSGVRRDYRGKGLALGLKVAGALFAKEYGIQTLRTTNDSTNPSILAINRKMGFVPRPAFILMAKSVGSTPSN